MSFSTFEQFKDSSHSEKTGLCILEAAKRQVGWEVYSGNIYRIAFSDSNVITSVEDDGTAITEAASLAEVVANRYYFDRDNDLLYVYLSDSSHPDSSFIAVVFRYFFSNTGVKAPHNLNASTGFEVYWLPLLQTTSAFKLEVDNRDTQLGLAIEGSATIRFINDQNFWSSRYDKVFFDNQRVFIYSWERTLPVSEAQILFKGRIQNKSYSSESIQFQAKDIINKLRDVFDLDTIENVQFNHPLFGTTLAKIPSGKIGTKQRLIFGKAYGVAASNIDSSVLDDTEAESVYLTGREHQVSGTTFSVTNGSEDVYRTPYYANITGWSLYSGSIYVADFTNHNILAVLLADAPSSGSKLYEVSELISVVAGSFYLDRVNDLIYIRLSDSSNPSSTSVYYYYKYDFTVGDKLYFINQPNTEYTVKEFRNATWFKLTEVFSGTPSASVQMTYVPEHDRGIHNRVFCVAGHPLSSADTVVQQVIDGSHFYVADASELFVGDNIIVTVNGIDYDRIIEAITDTNLITTTVLISPTPNVGDAVIRPGIQKVYMDKQLLIQGTDYEVDSYKALVKLYSYGPNFGNNKVVPEFNHSPVKSFSGRIAFTQTSQNVGAGSHPSSQTTAFTKEFKAGDFIQDPSGAWKEIWFVVSDEVMVLTEAANATGNIDNGLFKQVTYFSEGQNNIICDVRGRTSDNTVSGTWLRRGPDIVREILEISGVSSDDVDSNSFTEASELVPFDISVVVPENVTYKNSPKIRDVISSISRSILGTLLQNSDLKLAYSVISADKTDLEDFERGDLVDFSISSDSSKLVKSSVVAYQKREIDPTTLSKSDKRVTLVSDIGNYIIKTDREFIVETLLTSEFDATVAVGRWSFLLELATSRFSAQMKMNGSLLSVGDAVQVNHPKLYERFGSDIKRRLGTVSLISRGMTKTSMVVDDLSNAFSRVCTIAEADAPDYEDADDAEKVVSGYITEDNGLVGSDPDTLGLNVIWSLILLVYIPLLWSAL